MVAHKSSRLFTSKDTNTCPTAGDRIMNDIIEEVREAKRKVNARFDNDIQ